MSYMEYRDKIFDYYDKIRKIIMINYFNNKDLDYKNYTKAKNKFMKEINKQQIKSLDRLEELSNNEYCLPNIIQNSCYFIKSTFSLLVLNHYESTYLLIETNDYKDIPFRKFEIINEIDIISYYVNTKDTSIKLGDLIKTF